MLAIEFGEKHGSCPEAMEWRRSLGPTATQADAWKACPFGCWMLWQVWRGISFDKYLETLPALDKAVKRTAGTSWRHDNVTDTRSLNRAAEAWQKHQADEIRAEIPEWPGE